MTIIFCLLALPAILVPRVSGESGSELSGGAVELVDHIAAPPTNTSAPSLPQQLALALEASTHRPPTETPPPGYMSEDGDNMDQNDNLSKYSVQ